MDDGSSHSEGWDFLCLDESGNETCRQIVAHSPDAGPDSENDEGWDFDLEAASSAKASTELSGFTTPARLQGPRKLGRPFGIRGSHEYRRSLKEAAEPDEIKSASDKAKSVRLENLAKAREQRQVYQEKRRLSFGSDAAATSSCPERSASLVVQCAVDPSPAVGSALQSKLFESALSVFNSERCKDLCVGPAAPDNAMHSFSNQLLTGNSKCQPDCQGQGVEADVDDYQKSMAHFFQPYRAYCSLTRDADGLGVDRWQISKVMVRSACAFKNLAGKLWGNLMNHVQTLLDSSHNGLMIVCKLRFDETPTKITVADLCSHDMPNPDQQKAGKAQSRKQVCKLLQTEVSVGVLLQCKLTKKATLLTGSLPTPLQILDKQTARNLNCALEASIALPNFEEVAARFERKVFLCCADEFASNEPAQFGLQSSRTGWQRMATLCDIHKGSTVQGRVFDLSGPAISAIINLGLSMSPAGSIGKLQTLLTKIIRSRFQLRIGSPPFRPDVLAYKKAVFDLFFKVPDSFSMQVASSVSTKQRLNYGQKLRRRAILEHFCNGDIRSEQIVHWAPAGQYASEKHAENEFVKYVVPALIPHGMPLFPRSRWFGADASLDYIGVLACTHCVLEPLMEAWCGKGSAVASEIGDGNTGEAEHESGWEALCNLQTKSQPSNLSSQKPQVSQDNSVEHPDEQEQEQVPVLPLDFPKDGAEGVGDDPSAFDWHSYHDKLRTSVFDWLFRARGPRPQTMVCLMRQYMEPILKLMTKFLYISSQKWEKDQWISCCQTGERNFRMLLACIGKDTELVFASAAHLMKSPPVALAEVDWRQDVSVLAFTMLSRLVCATKQLIHWRHSKYPYKLFSALQGPELANKVFHDPPCLKDEITLALCSQFTEEEFCADQGVCRLVIEALALLAETDIGPIERQHTISRRVVQSRSLANPAVTLKSLSADWLLRQGAQRRANLMSYFFFDSSATRRKFNKFAKQRKCVRKTQQKKKKRGGGGGWRAFCSVFLKGQKGTRDRFKRAKAAYWALPEDERKRYRLIGELATKSHRAGFKPFGSRESHRMIQSNSEIAVPPAGRPSPSPPQAEPVSALEALAPGSLSSHQHMCVLYPSQDLLDKLKEIKKKVSQRSAEEAQDREIVVANVAAFLKGDALVQPSELADSFISRGFQDHAEQSELPFKNSNFFQGLVPCLGSNGCHQRMSLLRHGLVCSLGCSFLLGPDDLMT